MSSHFSPSLSPCESLLILTSLLSLPSPESTLTMLTFFHSYVLFFLAAHPDPQSLSDPDYAQIRLRLSLAAEHYHYYPDDDDDEEEDDAAFDWSNITAGCLDDQQHHQIVHATRFMDRVIGYYLSRQARWGSARDLRVMAVGDEYLLREAHKVLCLLQGVWTGNEAWIDVGKGKENGEEGGGEEGKEEEEEVVMREALMVLLEEIGGSGDGGNIK